MAKTKSTRDIVIDILKNPNIPMVTDEGLASLIDYFMDIDWKESKSVVHVDPSRKLQTSQIRPFVIEEELSEERKKELYYEVFKKIIRAMREDIEKFPNYFEEMGKKKNFKSYKKSDYINVIRLVESGRIEDALKTDLGRQLYEHCAEFTGLEGLGARSYVPYLLERRKTKGAGLRIYINTSNGQNGFEFVQQYISKCIDRRVPYKMKGLYNRNTAQADGTIFYVCVEDLEANIEILNEIKAEHPELLETFGTPITSAHNEDYFAVCTEPYSYRTMLTYNDMSSHVMYSIFTKSMAQLLLERYGDHFTEKQKAELTESAAMETDYNGTLDINYETKCHIPRSNTRTGSRNRLQMLMNNYYPYIETLVNKERELLITLMREKLAAVSSWLYYGDGEHIGHPLCFPMELYEYYGMDPTQTLFSEYLEGSLDKKSNKRNGKAASSGISVKSVVGEYSEKVVVTGDSIQKLIGGDESYLRDVLEVLGFSEESTKDLSEQQLRSMIFDRMMPNYGTIVDILCSGLYKLKIYALGMGATLEDIDQPREYIERFIIEKIGIDAVIVAGERMKPIYNNKGIKKSYIYENTLQGMRHRRGLTILASDEYNSLTTEEERNEFISNLPPHAQEDVSVAAARASTFARSDKTAAKMIVKKLNIPSDYDTMD